MQSAQRNLVTGRSCLSINNIKIIFLLIFGLLLRLAVVFFFSSSLVTEFYSPFLSQEIEIFDNPWKIWLENSGSITAFPYGYAMYFSFLPFSVLSDQLSIPGNISYFLNILLFDFALLLILKNQTKDLLKIMTLYWLSPLTLVIVYLFGFNDLIPVVFLISSISFLRTNRFVTSGFFLCMAISAKLSMILALPFFLIFFFRNNSIRNFISNFLKGFILGLTVFMLPLLLFNSEAIRMIFESPSSYYVLNFSIAIGDGVSIYLAPIVYTLILYYFWQIKHLNFQLIFAAIGVMFLAIALIASNVPGYLIWALPFIVIHQIFNDTNTKFLVSVFSFLYVFWILIFSIGPEFSSVDSVREILLILQQNIADYRIFFTSMIYSLGLILGFKLWRDAVIRSDFFHLIKTPFFLGLNGVGPMKSEIMESIEGIFGKHSSKCYVQNNYSLWDEKKPLVEVIGRYNPMTYSLSALSTDLVNLKANKKPNLNFSSNEFKVIIANGLHLYHLPILRKCFDLKIFIEIDKNLEIFFDDNSLSNKKQRDDIDKFISPEKEFSDLILSVKSARKLSNEEKFNELKLKLLIKSNHGFDEEVLTKVLVSLCGLNVVKSYSDDASETELSIEGDIYKDDVELAARILFPKLIDFFDIYPIWHDGFIGIVQLVILAHMEQSLLHRLIK